MPEPIRRASEPPAKRTKPLREQLHEVVNDQLVDMAEKGFHHIDRGKDLIVKKLESKGITGMEQIAETGANFLKALIARGISK